MQISDKALNTADTVASGGADRRGAVAGSGAPLSAASRAPTKVSGQKHARGSGARRYRTEPAWEVEARPLRRLTWGRHPAVSRGRRSGRGTPLLQASQLGRSDA